MGCSHQQFAAQVDVTRVLNGRDEEDGGELVAFTADVTVRCADCDAPFGWRGTECGVSVNGKPMRSLDALELRAWLVSPSELALLPQPHGVTAP